MHVFRPIVEYLDHIAVSLAALGLWLVLLGTVFVPLERLFTLRPSKVFRTAIWTDLGYYFINGVVPGLLLSIPLALAAWVAHRTIPPGFTASYAHWPLAARLFTALVVAEIGLYWGHRWCHEVPLLWRFHAVHHSSDHIDWLVNSRGHPVDFIFTRLCGLLPLFALGLGSPIAGETGVVPVVVMLAGPAWGFFIHANVRWRFGALEWLIATPAFHHWHHTNDGAAVINKNYAPMWPWVDRLFGSFYLPHDRHPVIYGIDETVAAGLVGQLIEPFAQVGVRATPAETATSGKAVHTGRR